MNTTPLQERPVWVPAGEVGTNRFDPLYYDPSLTIAEHYLRSNGNLRWKRVRDVVSDLYSFGAYELTNSIRFVEPGDDTYPFVNVTEVSNPFVEVERARHIDRASHLLLEKSRCVPGTLLLSMSGSIGRVGVLPENAGECNSNQHLAKMVVIPELHDAYFLAAYFTSCIGQSACHREAAGAVQKELYLYNISTLPVPDPPEPIRIAIGRKVRAAGRLRSTSEVNIVDAVRRVERFFGSEGVVDLRPNDDGSCGYFSAYIPGHQLDMFHGAQFYAPKRKRAVGLVRRTGTAERIGSQGHRIRMKGSRNGKRPHVDPANVSGIVGYWYAERGVDGGDTVLARPGAVLFLRMRPYLNKTTINDTDKTVSASPEFLIYEFDPKDAYYAALCLRQPWALAQVAEIATGDRPRVDGEFVDDVVVPWPIANTREEIGNLYKSSFALRRRADALVAQAIADVGNLIEGTLDASKCVEEGRQLADEFGLEVPQ